MNDRIEKLAAQNTPTRDRVAGVFQLAALVTLFVAFFGGLLASVFELFRFVDFLLLQDWTWGWRLFGRASLMFVVGVVVIRISWWLSLAILGLVTRKYDSPAYASDTILLDRQEHSTLHDRVDDICQQVKAPRPNQIRLNPLPQCFVIEERRFSFSTKRSLTLVLGLPQMLVFTMAELRVVLVHEMAHFGNSDTTLIVFLFRFVESLRLALSELRQRWWHRIDPLYWFFSTFYAALHFVAMPIQRRIELRADRISAALCGGDLAAHTLLKDWFIDGQFDEAAKVWCEHETESPARVNVFQLFMDRWRELSPDAEQYLVERFAQERRLPESDTHPTNHDRLTLMGQYPAVEFRDGRPALALLPDHKDLELEAAMLLHVTAE